MRRIATLRRLGRDRRGASVIELGLAMPVVGIMLVGLVDMASCFSAQLSIQQAAARSLERVQVNRSATDFAFVKTEAAAAAGVPVTQVTVERWLECDSVKQSATVTACPGTADAGKYIKVTVASDYVPFFPYSPLGTRNANGNVALSAAASVRYS